MTHRIPPFRVLCATAALWASAPALAQDDGRKEVSVKVVDLAGDPIPSAWVRIPDTEGRRTVDPETGKWSATEVYTLAGEEVAFVKGTVLDMTVSAPGYLSKSFAYEVAPRRNGLTITLEPMEELDLTDENDENLMIQWFKRTPPDQP